MAKSKKGDMFTCELCGMVVAVSEDCDCAVGELICCEEPMKKGKAAATKAKKKATAAKKVAKKPAAKKKGVKKAKAAAKPKKKTAAKKK